MNGVERSVSNFADIFKTAQRALVEQDRDVLVDALREMSVQKKPPHAVDWQPFARAATILGEATLAISFARQYLESAPQDSERQLYLAKTMTRFGRSDAAVKLLRDAIVQSPNGAALHEHLGIEYLRRGALTEASQALHQSLAIQAAPSNAWLALSKVRTFADGDPEIAELKAALARSGNSGARGGMFYALGKMLDDAGRHEEAFAAFAAFAEGAALIGGESPYASASVKQLLHETVANFTPAFLAELDCSTIDSHKPIFVMGMPRSGTTLAEQILASHPGVIGGGEHFLLNCAAMGVPHFTPNAMRAYAARNAGGNAWTKVGATYLRLLDDQFGQSQHIVDKSLAPFSVGAIAHIFPNARIIWMKRDPAAVAWSCFKTRFTDGLGWSWSFERIAHYFKIHDALHAHWTKLFPDKILTVSYADLVGAPDTWIPRLQAHAGLTEGDQTRSFQTVERTVRTASAVQVRKPIYTGADEAWRPYSRHMSGFFETYGAPPMTDSGEAVA